MRQSGLTDDNLWRPTRRAEEHYTKDKLSTRRGAVHSIGWLSGVAGLLECFLLKFFPNIGAFYPPPVRLIGCRMNVVIYSSEAEQLYRIVGAKPETALLGDPEWVWRITAIR